MHHFEDNIEQLLACVIRLFRRGGIVTFILEQNTSCRTNTDTNTNTNIDTNTNTNTHTNTNIHTNTTTNTNTNINTNTNRNTNGGFPCTILRTILSSFLPTSSACSGGAGGGDSYVHSRTKHTC